MARQFKLTITYQDLSMAEIYWHDNNDIEIVSLPPIVNSDSVKARLDIWLTMTNFCILNHVTKFECETV